MKLNNSLTNIDEYFDKNENKHNWQLVFKLLIECDSDKIDEYVYILTNIIFYSFF